MALERLQSDVGRLSACVDMRPHLVGGRLPALSELTQLRVQIFHTPDLSPTARKAKTVWSLRITVWINGVRAAEEIKGVQLYSCREFSQKVANLRGDVPTEPRSSPSGLDRDPEDMLVGMLRAKTRGKGTPYIADQFCVLLYHLTEVAGSRNLDRRRDRYVLRNSDQPRERRKVRRSGGTSGCADLYALDESFFLCSTRKMHRDAISLASLLVASLAASPLVRPGTGYLCRYGRCIEIWLTYIASCRIGGRLRRLFVRVLVTFAL